MYARIIQLQMDDEWLRITEFFLTWLGTGVTITHFPVAGTLPAMTVVSSTTYTIVVSAGTASNQQLALQAFEGLQGPTMNGTWRTLPLWFNTSTVLINRLNALGVNPATPIMLAGHSYGGAVCALTALRLRQGTPDRWIRLLTFGMPKPGDRALNDALYQIESAHVVNHQDLVPQLPLNLEQSSWFPILVNAALAALWSQWEHDLPVLLVANNGDITDAVLPSLTDDILRPLVFRVVTFQPIAPIGPHFISEYLRRMAGCICPRWPFDEASWNVLFRMVGADAAVNLGGECPAIGRLTLRLPIFKAIGELVIGAAAELAAGNLVVGPPVEPAIRDTELVVGPPVEAAGGELVADFASVSMGSGHLKIGAPVEAAAGELVAESFLAGHTGIEFFPRYNWAAPYSQIGCYVRFGNGKWFVGVIDHSPGGAQEEREIFLDLDTTIAFGVEDDGTNIYANCGGQTPFLQALGGTPGTPFVQMGVYNPPQPIILPCVVEAIVYSSALNGTLWLDSFDDADGTDLPPHVADVHPVAQAYIGNPGSMLQIQGNELVVPPGNTFDGFGYVNFNPEETSATATQNFFILFRIKSP